MISKEERPHWREERPFLKKLAVMNALLIGERSKSCINIDLQITKTECFMKKHNDRRLFVFLREVRNLSGDDKLLDIEVSTKSP